MIFGWGFRDSGFGFLGLEVKTVKGEGFKVKGKRPPNNAHARELASSAIFEIGWACEDYKATE